MRRVLLLGSGFLLSNFIRYVSFRTRNEFKFITVSKFSDRENLNKLIYFNKNHEMITGDVQNVDLVNGVIKDKKPDIIIDGTSTNIKQTKNDYGFRLYEDLKLKLDNIYNYSKQVDKYINIIPLKEKSFDICRKVNKNIITVALPNCFGLRQPNDYFGIPHLIKNLPNEATEVCYDWVYSEDVASFIWFLIETRKFGRFLLPNYLKISNLEILNMIIKAFDIKKDIEVNESLSIKYNNPYFYNMNYSLELFADKSNLEWESDYGDLMVALEKTINWYKANKWAL